MADDESIDDEFDTILRGLFNHLEGVLSDVTLEIADCEWFAGEPWCAITTLAANAARTGVPVDQNVIDLFQRAISITSPMDLDDDDQAEVAELRTNVAGLKQHTA